MKLKKTVITIISICLCGFLSFRILSLFRIEVDNHQTYQSEAVFYEQKENSLDAVFIGGSAVYRFWEPPLAWDDYGFTSWSFSIPAMNAINYPYIIKEIDKTQPDALLMISLNGFINMNIDAAGIYRNTSYMPLSRNKIEMIHDLANKIGYYGWDQLEFYFPIMRFHDRWSELNAWDFNHKPDPYKSGAYEGIFWSKKNVAYFFKNTDEEIDATKEQTEFLNELFEFLDQCGHEVLFVVSPQALNADGRQLRMNRMCSLIQEQGYGCLNLYDYYDETGIQPETDYYNERHTNIHGAIKSTDFIARYLVENYGFSDKRGQPGYEDWDEAAVLYNELISPYTLPFERENAPRNYELAIPKLNEPERNAQKAVISWNASAGSMGYDIYRKSDAPGEESWAYLAGTDSAVLEYKDSGLLPDVNYTYTVVPKIITDGKEIYGNFNFSGVEAKTAEE